MAMTVWEVPSLRSHYKWIHFGPSNLATHTVWQSLITFLSPWILSSIVGLWLYNCLSRRLTTSDTIAHMNAAISAKQRTQLSEKKSYVLEFHIRRTIVAGLIELGILENTVDYHSFSDASRLEASTEAVIQSRSRSQPLPQQQSNVDKSSVHDISFVNLSLLTPGCVVAQVS